MVSEQTKKIYGQKMKTLMRDHNVKMKDLSNVETITKKISTISSNINTIRTYLQAILYFLRNMKSRNHVLEQKYSEAITDLSKEMISNMEKNKLSASEADSYLPWDEIIKARDKLRDSKGITNLKAYLLIGLYTYIPPRRVKDYLLMKYVTDEDKLDDEYNYLIIDGDTVLLIFNTYKGSDKKGPIEIEFDAPRIYLEKLKEYIDKKDIKRGDLMFGFKGQPELSNYIKRTMKRMTGKDVSVNLFRHSYISNNITNNMSVEEKKHIAELMGHSKGVQDLYHKIV